MTIMTLVTKEMESNFIQATEKAMNITESIKQIADLTKELMNILEMELSKELSNSVVIPDNTCEKYLTNALNIQEAYTLGFEFIKNDIVSHYMSKIMGNVEQNHSDQIDHHLKNRISREKLTLIEIYYIFEKDYVFTHENLSQQKEVFFTIGTIVATNYKSINKTETKEQRDKRLEKFLPQTEAEKEDVIKSKNITEKIHKIVRKYLGKVDDIKSTKHHSDDYAWAMVRPLLYSELLSPIDYFYLALVATNISEDEEVTNIIINGVMDMDRIDYLVDKYEEEDDRIFNTFLNTKVSTYFVASIYHTEIKIDSNDKNEYMFAMGLKYDLLVKQIINP